MLVSVDSDGGPQCLRKRFFPAGIGAAWGGEAVRESGGYVARAVCNIGQLKKIVRLGEQPGRLTGRQHQCPLSNGNCLAAGGAAEDPIASTPPPGLAVTPQQGHEAPASGGGTRRPGFGPTDQIGDGRPEVGRQQQITATLRRLAARRIDQHRRHMGQFGIGGRLIPSHADLTVQAQR